ALDVLGRTFGVCSYSPVDHTCVAELAEIVRLGAEAYAPLVAGKSFAVRARRIGTHDYTSVDIQYALGARLRPGAARVDLRRPEVEVFVEVREQVAYLYSRILPGPNGLPL